MFLRSSAPPSPADASGATDTSSPPITPRRGASTWRKSRLLTPPQPAPGHLTLPRLVLPLQELSQSAPEAPVSPSAESTTRSPRKSPLSAHSPRKHKPRNRSIPDKVPPTAPPGPDPFWTIAARLYLNGLGALLDDQGDDVQEPLSPEVTRAWAAHLAGHRPIQLSFFLEESPDRLQAMGLSAAHAQVRVTLHRLAHPARVPSAHDWQAALEVQAALLEERLCALEPAPMAVWLQQVHETLLRPTADPRSADDVKRLLRVLAAVTAHETFQSQGWLGGSTETLALRHAVTDLLRDLAAIVRRCPDADDAARAELVHLASRVRL